MTIHVVTRHCGALEWLAQHGIWWDRHHRYLDLDCIKTGDQVIGILPMSVAASVCARGASYRHICLDMPDDCRGRELSSEQMAVYGAQLQQFVIVPQASPF